MPAIAGLRGTGDWATDERPKSFRDAILWRNPNGTAPIFGLMSKVKKKPVDDSEFAWWDEPNDIVRLQVNGTIASGVTTVLVDSPDPTSGSPDDRWGTATNLKPGDLLMVDPATDAATFTMEVVEVVQVVSATEIVIARGAAGTTAATITDNYYLTKIGSVFAEGTGAPSATNRNPVKYTNYTQIFKDTYELTGSAVGTKLRTGDPVQNDKKRKAFDHARDIEMAILFGQKSETTGSNGKPKRTMGGIRSYLGTTTSKMLGASWTLNDFMDAVSPVFNWDTEAGDTRACFMGNGAMNKLNQKIAAQTGAVNINYVGMAKQYGMAFAEYRIPQGSLYLKTHPLLSRHTLYTNSMFIIDFSSLTYRPRNGRDTTFKDNVQADDEDVRRGFWQTDAGIEVAYGGLTNGYIGGFNL